MGTLLVVHTQVTSLWCVDYTLSVRQGPGYWKMYKSILTREIFHTLRSKCRGHQLESLSMIATCVPSNEPGGFNKLRLLEGILTKELDEAMESGSAYRGLIQLSQS